LADIIYPDLLKYNHEFVIIRFDEKLQNKYVFDNQLIIIKNICIFILVRYKMINIIIMDELEKKIPNKNRLIELIGGRIIYLYCGKYSRLIGKIKLNDNNSVYINDIMVQEGHG
jgi:hypothetical protein